MLKVYLLLSTLLVSTAICSTPSYSEWTNVGTNVRGTTYYLDFDRLRKHDGFVYYWWLSDLAEQDQYGDLSYISYNQADCKLFRYKHLSSSYHSGPMGTGVRNDVSPPDEWYYPTPASSNEHILNQICSR